MKILAVNWQDLGNPHAGGAEIHLFEILTRLVRRGHDVTLLCSGWKDAPGIHSYKGIEIHRTGDRFSFPVKARGYFRRSLRRRNFEVILEDINKVPLCTPLWKSGAPVVALVPHLFGTTAFSELSIPLASLVWISERPVPAIYRRSLFHAISKSTADDLVARGVRREQITVIYPGIDSDHFTPDPSRRSVSPMFTYVGRLKRYKGVDIIIRALAKMTSVDARLEVAGTGDYRPELERLAQSLGLGDRVAFLGYISEDLKLDLLRRAWAMVFTSPKEGWGITNLEAQACGTPVVASDSPGLRESVLRDESGLLIPHGNVDLLAGALDRLAGSPDIVRRMGERGREFAATFSWDETAVRTEAHLKSAIEGARRK